MNPPPGLFVTGTDTGVGKTWVAAAIARSLGKSGVQVGVLKPVASGAEPGPDGQPIWRDAETLGQAIGGGIARERIAPIVFEAPLAPSVASRLEGQPLSHDRVWGAVVEAVSWWSTEQLAQVMVIEGVGGLLCPLAEGTTVADLAEQLDYPLVIVARRGLGTLNHTLLTVESAVRRGLRVAGIVLNGAEPTVDRLVESTNPGELVRRLPSEVPLLADLPHCSDPVAAPLWSAFDDVDWRGRAAGPRRTWGEFSVSLT